MQKQKYERKPHTVPDELRWAFRVHEVAARSGLSRSEIHSAINRGDLPARQYRGRVWLIDPAEARAWLDRMCETTQAA